MNTRVVRSSSRRVAARRDRAFGEQALALPEHEGEDPQAVLVDEAVADQRLGEVPAAVHVRLRPDVSLSAATPSAARPWTRTDGPHRSTAREMTREEAHDGAMGSEDPQVGGAERSADAVHIRTFLIADVRGWTVFTQERGDEGAGKLAAKFARLVREVVEGRGGQLLELRGDEAMCVFGSPRQAIRAAADLQERFVEETLADPELPLTVGIGLDAGEAVEVEGGYRGGALNLAARLCSQAVAGEILASREVAHLARRVEGVTYQDRGSISLKGLSEPVAFVRVVPDGVDLVERLSPYAPVRTRSRGADAGLPGRRSSPRPSRSS